MNESLETRIKIAKALTLKQFSAYDKLIDEKVKQTKEKYETAETKAQKFELKCKELNEEVTNLAGSLAGVSKSLEGALAKNKIPQNKPASSSNSAIFTSNINPLERNRSLSSGPDLPEMQQSSSKALVEYEDDCEVESKRMDFFEGKVLTIFMKQILIESKCY